MAQTTSVFVRFFFLHLRYIVSNFERRREGVRHGIGDRTRFCFIRDAGTCESITVRVGRRGHTVRRAASARRAVNGRAALHSDRSTHYRHCPRSRYSRVSARLPSRSRAPTVPPAAAVANRSFCPRRRSQPHRTRALRCRPPASDSRGRTAMMFPGSGLPAPRASVDDPDQMPLMAPSSPSPPTLTPQRNDGARASVVVTVDGSGASSSIRIVRGPSSSLSSQPPPPPSSTGSRRTGSANVKSPSRSAHSSASAKTSAQVQTTGGARVCVGGRICGRGFTREIARLSAAEVREQTRPPSTTTDNDNIIKFTKKKYFIKYCACQVFLFFYRLTPSTRGANGRGLVSAIYRASRGPGRGGLAERDAVSFFLFLLLLIRHVNIRKSVVRNRRRIRDLGIWDGRGGGTHKNFFENLSHRRYRTD